MTRSVRETEDVAPTDRSVQFFVRGGWGPKGSSLEFSFHNRLICFNSLATIYFLFFARKYLRTPPSQECERGLKRGVFG